MVIKNNKNIVFSFFFVAMLICPQLSHAVNILPGNVMHEILPGNVMHKFNPMVPVGREENGLVIGMAGLVKVKPKSGEYLITVSLTNTRDSSVRLLAGPSVLVIDSAGEARELQVAEVEYFDPTHMRSTGAVAAGKGAFMVIIGALDDSDYEPIECWVELECEFGFNHTRGILSFNFETPEIQIKKISKLKVTIKNDSDENIQIGQMRTSLGCLGVKKSDEEKQLGPGDTYVIKLKTLDDLREEAGCQEYLSVTYLTENGVEKKVIIPLGVVRVGGAWGWIKDHKAIVIPTIIVIGIAVCYFRSQGMLGGGIPEKEGVRISTIKKVLSEVPASPEKRQIVKRLSKVTKIPFPNFGEDGSGSDDGMFLSE